MFGIKFGESGSKSFEFIVIFKVLEGITFDFGIEMISPWHTKIHNDKMAK